MHRIRVPLLMLFVVMLAFPTYAYAGDNDFVLSRFSQCAEGTTAGVMEGPMACRAEEDIEAFETFSKQIGLVFTPTFLSPAETLGVAGFAVGFETKFSIVEDGAHWAALNGVAEGETEAPLFTLLQFHLRKGLPFSFELEGIVSWLTESEMAWIGGGIKWSLHEGFEYIPDISIRGYGGALTGAPDLNLANAGLDISLSYAFGIVGFFSLTPYAGYSHAWIIASSRVIDADPGYGATPSGNYSPEFVFEEKTLEDNRGFIGLRAIFDFFSFTIEANLGSEVKNVGLNIGLDY